MYPPPPIPSPEPISSKSIHPLPPSHPIKPPSHQPLIHCIQYHNHTIPAPTPGPTFNEEVETFIDSFDLIIAELMSKVCRSTGQTKEELVAELETLEIDDENEDEDEDEDEIEDEEFHEDDPDDEDADEKEE